VAAGTIELECVMGLLRHAGILRQFSRCREARVRKETLTPRPRRPKDSGASADNSKERLPARAAVAALVFSHVPPADNPITTAQSGANLDNFKFPGGSSFIFARETSNRHGRR
jgi:hypothetical protein